MNRLLRPATLLLVLLVLTLAASLLVLPPLWGPASAQVVPRPVPAGDQEVVWLNTATNAVAWERFVAAVRQLAGRPGAPLKIVADENAFPSQTASVPELAIAVPGAAGRLWFRWYKLTGETGAAGWVQALAGRSPPPLAIVGGGSTDRARHLALALCRLPAPLAARPLLLVTTATSERVDCEGQACDLMAVYPGRSFRFCFTNRQMVQAVTHFVWQQDALRPDEAPAYGVRWEDDPYSTDLYECFHESFGPDQLGGSLDRRRAARVAARDWAGMAGWLGAGNPLPSLALDVLRPPPAPFWSASIPFSVGTFNRPNRWETQAAEGLVDALAQNPTQRRPLLVLPANPQPAQRFLRAIARTAPTEAGRFIVVTGDALDFNTIYRDRNLKWPVQDLPFTLVLFCHRNPVEAGAFRPSRPGLDAPPDPAGPTSTGTQDLVLYRDIAETMVQAAYREGGLLASPDELGRRLRDARLDDGRARFDSDGNQPSGVGEYVVCLLPDRDGDRVAPRSRLQVWTRSADADGAGHWMHVPVAGKSELVVSYAPGVVPEGAP